MDPEQTADNIDAVDTTSAFQEEIEYATQLFDQYKRARHYLRGCAFHGDWTTKKERFVQLYAEWRTEGASALDTFRTEKSRRAAELVFGMIYTMNAGVES